MLPEWVSPWWQAACLPDKWIVCGESVPSLSIWHTFALENIGNRYMSGGLKDRDDAASLLLCARHDHAGGRLLVLNHYHRQREMRRMYKRLRRREWPEIDAACSEYVETCTRAPRRWQKDGEGAKGCAVPYQVHLVRALCADYGFDIEAAWNTPYAYGRMLYDGHAEANGDTSLMKPEYEALDDEMVAQQEAGQSA